MNGAVRWWWRALLVAVLATGTVAVAYAGVRLAAALYP